MEHEKEIERLRMQLVACGVVAMSNTPESADLNREIHPDYMSASCQGVMDAVDREMALRHQRDELVRQRDELLAATKKYEEAFDLIFSQCCSNGIFDAWGGMVNCTTLNEAHCMAGNALDKVIGG